MHLPRGSFHAFRSTGRIAGKLVAVAVPGGIEESFEEAALFSEGRPAKQNTGRERPVF